MGFKEDALSKSKSNYSSWKKDNKTMKMKKLSEIYEETTYDATAEYEALEIAWRNYAKILVHHMYLLTKKIF